MVWSQRLRWTFSANNTTRALADLGKEATVTFLYLTFISLNLQHHTNYTVFSFDTIGPAFQKIPAFHLDELYQSVLPDKHLDSASI